MKYYLYSETKLSDNSWVPEYLAKVTPLVQKYEGKFLARTPKIEQLEGETQAPQVVTLLEFPSREAAMNFYLSSEYAPYRKKRLAGSSGSMFLVAGEDIAQPNS